MSAARHDHTARICYEIFVRSFCDSNGDGIGDLKGIISKLDYLQNLGIEAIWLTPVHPSPSYHKYDVTDYYGIEPEYGTLDDFRTLLREAHLRNIQIYLDLIINHTSTLHPWFNEARKGPENAFRSFYWWMQPEQIAELGISKREMSDDSQVVYPWHDNGQDPEKYYGLFFKGMPDLNYHSEQLKDELEKIIRFWLADVGVDGFRLDAARHVFPEWEKEQSIGFWQYFAGIVERTKPGAFTVGEVWADAEEVAPYFRFLNATFHFDLSFALQRILVSEKDENLIARLLGDYALFQNQNPAFIDAIMLTNHDQERIGSVVGGHLGKMKLAAAILMTLPGQPYIYYGEEIGMLGSKPDPYIREPFMWAEQGDDRAMNTYWIEPIFSTPKTVRPFSAQHDDKHSIYHHYRNLIQLRKSTPALWQIARPNLLGVDLNNDQLLSYLRPHSAGDILIIHNLAGAELAPDLPPGLSGFRKVLFSSDPNVSDSWTSGTISGYNSLILSA